MEGKVRGDKQKTMSNFSAVVLTSHSDPKVRSHYYQKLKLLNALKNFYFL